MSISPRSRRPGSTAIAVRCVGVASAAAALALGVAGTALASGISDFSAAAVCDGGKGVIRVTDTDPSRTPATITVYSGTTEVGAQVFVPTSTVNTVDFPVDWAPLTQYRVHISAGVDLLDADISPVLTTPATGCAASAAPASSSAAAPTTAAASPTGSTAAPVLAKGNAPSPAAGGTTDLAETGGGSSTGVIAGAAAALLVAGGGAVYLVRRRGAAARH